ncbi:hypothetical protein [Nitrincola sp. MINF-07-Sa-05]|uniref:hypothetical protein n=1 Tax=Nitrincola salilacus TaxID=3400273 RepID=UPI003917CE24
MNTGKDRNQAVPHDTEDRGWWYLHGEKLEEKFVSICRGKLKINASINPQKIDDKTVPDLIVEGALADLKTQNTPFFTVSRYNMDPRFTVTFNRKDYERYQALYPDIVIYFWLDWTQTRWQKNEVEYLGGVFRLPFSAIVAMIESGAPEHHYVHRQSPEDRNAKSSFLLDVRTFETLFIAKNRDGTF